MASTTLRTATKHSPSRQISPALDCRPMSLGHYFVEPTQTFGDYHHVERGEHGWSCDCTGFRFHYRCCHVACVFEAESHRIREQIDTLVEAA